MSAAGQAVRVDGDAYYTPRSLARACVGTLGNLAGAWCLEPHAGGGAFTLAMREAGAQVWAQDIDPRAPALAPGANENRCCKDFRKGMPIPLEEDPPDWIVGNGPFSDLEEHIRLASQRAKVGAAFLCRLAFLEGKARYKGFWSRTPHAHHDVLVSRPSFEELYEDGTVGPLRRRYPKKHVRAGEIMLKPDGSPMLAGVDSAAYAFFTWRRGHVGPATQGWLEW